MTNKVILIGRLGSDSQIKKTNSGLDYTKLNLATSTGHYDSQKKWIEETQWHDVTVWWKVEAGKGDIVYVEGELVYNKGNDGIKYASVRAKAVKVISSSQKGEKMQQSGNFAPNSADDVDLPF